MKKIGLYLVLMAGGILLGYFFFNNTSESTEKIDEDDIHVHGVWTCSMHPQIKAHAPGSCPLCAMDLVFIEDGDDMMSDDQFEMNESALALANIQTTTIGSLESSALTLKLSGSITTNAETDAIQTTLYEGRIDELYPNYVGKKVWKGQEIGKIYSPELYLAQDKLLTSLSYRESHPKLYDAARYSLGLWKMTDEQIEQMLADGKPMMNFPMYSDVTGTVTEVLGSEGNFYDEGAPIFKVSNLNTVWGVFDAYEEQLSLLKVGQELSISLTAIPNRKFTGKIDFIEPILNNTKRTATIRVVLNNQKGELKPGMFADALVKSAIPDDNVLTIPESAVLWTGKRSVVYTKPYFDKPIFELREVDLGQRLQEGYVLNSGLNRGDEVVVNGAFTIDASAQLAGKNSMMNHQFGDENDNENMHLQEIKDVKNPKPLNITEADKVQIFLSQYFELKDALVRTNFESAKKKIEALNATFDDILKTPAFKSGKWDSLNQTMTQIQSAKSIEEVRKYFKPFSQELIALVKDLDVFDETIYVQFCPMADNNKGAYWLSLQEEIRNPYFGDKMLICGLVKEEIN